MVEHPKPNHLHMCIRHAVKSLMYSSIAAMSLGAASAAAQNGAEAEEVVVTGSRIRTNGMNSPTPVTVVTLEEIEMLNPASIVDGLADLPQFNGSFTTENFGVFFFDSPGSGTLSLRGLQSQRTLSLLDGKRIVGSSIFAGPDVNLFPLQLLQTVETVTGGATAAYGTDAVAGAVNFILDKDYEGFRANIATGMTEEGRFKNNRLSMAGGFDLTERAHVLFSAERSKQDQELGRNEDFDWYRGVQFMDNPDPNAGESRDNPLLIPAPWVVSNTESLDGIIHFPQLQGAANDGARQAFIDKYGYDRFILDPNGNASLFQEGAYVDIDANSLVGGGSGTINDEFSRQFMPRAERESYFTYLDYDIADNFNVHLEAMYGKVNNFSTTTVGTNLTGAGNQNVFFGSPTALAPLIYSGNPYIPDNIQQIMDDEGFEYLTLGKTAHPDDIGHSFVQQITDTLSVNVGFDYEIESDGFFDGWLIKGYYQDGHSDAEYIQGNTIRQDRIYLAMDAVEDPNNPGNIICNVSQYLFVPENAGAEGCVPYNPFGRGQANAAAVDWVTDYEAGIPVAVDGHFINEFGEYDPIYYEYISGRHKTRVVDLNLENWELSADGVLFEEGLGAGPISMAIGYASRKENFQQVVQAAGANPANDPDVSPPAGTNNPFIGRRGISSSIQGSFQDILFSNVPFAKGQYKVDEAFVEFLVPVVADLPFVDRFDVGLAGRWADYENIDQVSSWKFSYTWAVNDELRFRGTISRDVRAPTMAERYDRTGEAGFFIRDTGIKADCAVFEFGCFQFQTLAASFGSTNLKPENAKTITAGLIYQPSWMEGLSYSMDWYFIKINDNINQLGIQNVINGCHIDGIEELCQYILREGPPSSVPGLNQISFVFNPYINQDYTIAKGVDFELGYNTEIDIFGGGERLSLRLLGSYLREQIYNFSGVDQDWVDRFWAPWTANISANYFRGPLSVSLQTNYNGKTIADISRNTYDEDLGRVEWDVANNENQQPMLVSARVGYNMALKNGSNLNLSLNIQNLFDKSPRMYPSAFSGDGITGDIRGRQYNFSVGFTY